MNLTPNPSKEEGEPDPAVSWFFCCLDTLPLLLSDSLVLQASLQTSQVLKTCEV
jgi:hypothetical protein